MHFELQNFCRKIGDTFHNSDATLTFIAGLRPITQGGPRCQPMS